MREQLKGKGGSYFLYFNFPKDDLPQKLRFYSSGTRRTGQRVVNKEFQRVFAMRLVDVFNLRNDLAEQYTVVNWLGMQSLCALRSSISAMYSSKALIVLMPFHKRNLYM